MQSFDSHPALAELRHLAREARAVRIAARAANNAAPDRGPDHDQAHLAELRRDLATIEARRDEILRDVQVAQLYGRALDDRATTLRVAVQMFQREQRAQALRDRADAATARAIREHRLLTSREQARAAELREAADYLETQSPAIDVAARRDAVLAAVGALRLREARTQMREGLLRTQQMRGIIAEATPAVLRGDPILLLGETGGAKTALAEHLARHASGREPELVSGYGDITSAQLIGSHELRVEHGATVTSFAPGPLLRAMIEGRPVILDEVNAMPAEFLKRLNRILQLRPGDTLHVQENAGAPVLIAPGFAILATANEQTPHRYRGLDRLSAELVNRFGAGSYRVHYPDATNRYEDYPRENALLAAAAIVDARGQLPPHLPEEALTRAARAAFISQQVFAGAHGEGFGNYVSTERDIDGRPGLEETVLAPRTLVAIMHKVAASAGSITLDHALSRFVEGVMHAEDRRVLALIISGQGFRIGQGL
ncbi:MoxR-like ATPase [Leucobacter exalbidus]|uniref:MoxR-like ATPase n=1 Tax=Leucobacter exalbidus TaxID=662960 RepID=A0A940T2J4_9MICO|nr:AAA family ATPase [Leucobacter exalbidus]MBP1325127.1 MoxR-like ATPase [Leucobacter exalbidus]